LLQNLISQQGRHSQLLTECFSVRTAEPEEYANLRISV